MRRKRLDPRPSPGFRTKEVKGALGGGRGEEQAEHGDQRVKILKFTLIP